MFYCVNKVTNYVIINLQKGDEMTNDFKVKKHNKFLLIFFIVMIFSLTLFPVVITQTQYIDSRTLSMKKNIATKNLIVDNITTDVNKIQNGTTTLSYLDLDDPNITINIPETLLKPFMIIRMKDLIKNNDDPNLHFIYHFNNKIYYERFDSLEILFNIESYYLFVVDKDGNAQFSSDPTSTNNIKEYIEDSAVFLNALEEDDVFIKKVNFYF